MQIFGNNGQWIEDNFNLLRQKMTAKNVLAAKKSSVLKIVKVIALL